MASGIKSGLSDSGWIEATLGSNFKDYTDSGTPAVTTKYRRVGNFVNIIGCVSPKSALTINTDNRFTITTLPEGFRPTKPVYEICQGSTQNVWMLTVNTTGDVTLGRYRMINASSYTNCPAGAWLPFSVFFEVV